MTLIEPLVIQVCGDADDTFKAQHVASVDADFGGGTGSLKVHCSVKISQLIKPTILFACSMTWENSKCEKRNIKTFTKCL